MDEVKGMHLIANESIIWAGHLSYRAFFGWFIIGIILIPFIIGLLILLYPLLVWLTTEYCITNKRIYCKFGIISRSTREIEITKISDVTLRQGIFGRILNYGDLYFSSYAMDNVKFLAICDPLEIQRIARNQLSEESEKGLKQGENLNSLITEESIKDNTDDTKKIRIERMEDKFFLGEISQEQLEDAKRKIEIMNDF